MDRVQQQHHVEDVGRILLQTQEQLRLMREQVAASAAIPASSLRYVDGAAQQPDVRAFQDILERAELEIRAKAELVLNGLVNSSSQSSNSQNASQGCALPAVTTPTHATASPTTRPRQNIASLLDARRNSRQENDASDIDYFRSRFQNPTVELRSYPTPSPVQRITKGKLVKKKMTQHTRLLPSVNKCDPSAPTPELSAQDAQHGMLSLVNRGFVPVGVDLTPAFTNSHGSIIKQTKTRIYDRHEQPIRPAVPYTNPSGFNIASLKFDIAAAVADRNNESDDADRDNGDDSAESVSTPRDERRASFASPPSSVQRTPNVLTVNFQGSGARGTLHASVGTAAVFPTQQQRHQQSLNQETESRPEADSCDHGIANDNTDGTDDMDELRRNVEKVRGYNELLDAYSLHQFIIHKGRALRETPEFVSFQRVAQDVWGSVDDVIHALEALLTRYFVPLAYIDGQRLMAVAAAEATTFSKRELLACIVNEDQVNTLVRRPGQRYRGKDRKRRAATTIQNVVRMWWQQRLYRRLRSHVSSVEAIQRRWRAFASHSALKRRLQAQRAQQLGQYDAQMVRLRRDWHRIKTARRVVIHVPSLSVDERTRVGADNFATLQNLQLSRLSGALVDPNVDVVYVSPFELTADVAQYVIKLLQLGGIVDPVARVKLVFPEQAARFPGHFSLATLLLYSPHCLRRIRRYVRHKEAYLVMGAPGAEDQRLAIALNVPILGCDPLAALPLLTKSSAKRFFMRADVNVPTGTYDVYDDDELVFALAKLVVAHIAQNIWVLKLDYDPFGTGTAVVDVSRLAALRELRREKRSPEYWKQPGTRDNAARVLIAELEHSLAHLVTPLHTDVYPNWLAFADAIAQFGVVLEAAPNGVVGHVRANLFVEPSGEVHVSSTQDMIVRGGGGRGSATGANSGAGSDAKNTACAKKPLLYAFPQSAAPYEAIHGASTAIGRLLAQELVVGYASVDFLVFHEDKTHAPRLWAMALHPFLTDSAATFATFHLLNRGTIDTHTGFYHLAASSAPSVTTSGSSSHRSERNNVAPTAAMLASDLVLHEATHSGLQSRERRASNASAGAARSYVVSEYICHPSISTMQYSTFFHTCRLHGVCFDVERCVGTVFLLADSLTAGVFGIMCCSDAPSGALGYLRTALEVIAREVGVQPVVDDFSDSGSAGNFADVLGVVRALTGGKSAKLEKIRGLRRSSG